MQPQNLLVIMSDEHNPKMLGAAGHPLVKTQNLDRLAARGTRFDRAYTNCPICVPARASFATGRYVHDIEYWDNSIAYDGRIESWGHKLQAKGIRCDSIGKLHYRLEADPTGFDKQHIPKAVPRLHPAAKKKGQWRRKRRPRCRPRRERIHPLRPPGRANGKHLDPRRSGAKRPLGVVRQLRHTTLPFDRTG